MTGIIKFDKVSVRFTRGGESFTAVDEASLEINKGEFFGIVGASGAGKSTLVRTVNLLQRPTSGKIYVAGEDVTSLKDKQLSALRLKTGMIFQHFNLIKNSTVFDNVAFALLASKTPKDKIAPKVNELLELVGLADKASLYPNDLSGGQKQRVGIARALATAPEILLCDEATSALDPDTTEQIQKLLQRVNREMHVTILFVTHMINVITKLCDNVAVMEQGRVVEYGSVLDVFSSPKSKIAKRFVSSVIPDQIPQSVITTLKKDPAPYKLIRFRLKAESFSDNMIWQIDTGFDIESNVMFASVTELQGVVLSVIIMQIKGEAQNVQRVLDFLNSRGIKWEELAI